MLRQRWFSSMQAIMVVGALLVLAACSPAATTQTGSGPTDTAVTVPTATATPVPPTATATFAPPTCSANFTSTTYVTTLPDASYPQTTVYAQVQLPPLTRSFDDDATGGFRGRRMCSGGTTASVQSFMQTHLAGQGWQQITTTDPSCTTVIPGYTTAQCWKNGSYTLFLGININTDWIITFRAPDFLPEG